MNKNSEQTKKLLAVSLMELMKKYPFEKISVKMLTENAGVLRPSFYYYFQDKYELLEWLLENEIFGGADSFMRYHMTEQAITFVCLNISTYKSFFRKAFEISGQNNFVEIFTNCAARFIARNYTFRCEGNEENRFLCSESVSALYALSFVGMVRLWLGASEDLPVEELISSYLTFVRSNFRDFYEH